jgi:hypothetical protein
MQLPVFLQSSKKLILTEVTQIRGFMQILMKPRNGSSWSREDRAAILVHMRRLAKTVPLLAIFSLPGGGLLLPVLAWFLDRRQGRKKPAPSPAPSLASQQPVRTHVLAELGKATKESQPPTEPCVSVGE